MHPNELEDIYQLVSEKVQQLIGDGITAIAILNEKQRTLSMGSFHGLDSPIEQVFRIIGFDPWKKEFPLDSIAEEN